MTRCSAVWRDFDALIGRAHELGLKVLMRPRAEPHLAPAPMVPRKPDHRPRKSQGRLRTSGPTPSPTVSPPKQLAVDLRRSAGNGRATGCMYFLHNFLRGAAGPEPAQSAGAGGIDWVSRASGWIAAVDGLSALDTINFYFPRSAVARQSRARSRTPQCERSRPRLNP